MKEKEILGKIDEILNGIIINDEEIESYNTLINEKLEDIQSYKNEDKSAEIYNARRNIGAYKILSYLINDKVRETNKQIQTVYDLISELINTLKSNNESEENYGK